MSAPRFKDWLAEQEERHDPVGDLATDAAADPAFPDKGGLRAVRLHLKDMNACDEALEAADLAWHEFSRGSVGRPPSKVKKS
jgi:hypothetical protein